MTTPRHAPARRALGRLAGLAAPCLLACGVGGQHEFDDYLDPFRADVYVHNGTGDSVELRVHPLAPAAGFDCDAIAGDPTALASGPSFDAAPLRLLSPGATAPARAEERVRECHAALLEIDGDARLVLFWYEGLYPVRWVDGLIEDPADHGPGAVLLSRDEGGALRWDSLGEPLVYALDDDA